MRQESAASGTETIGRYQKKSPLVAHNHRRAGGESNGAAAGMQPPSLTQPPQPGAKNSTLFDKLKVMFKANGAEAHDEHAPLEVCVPHRLGLKDGLQMRSHTLRTSRSNPDLAGHHLVGANGHDDNGGRSAVGGAAAQLPEYAVKVFKSDQTFRFIAVFPHTTARHIVELALQVRRRRTRAAPRKLAAAAAGVWHRRFGREGRMVAVRMRVYRRRKRRHESRPQNAHQTAPAAGRRSQSRRAHRPCEPPLPQKQHANGKSATRRFGRRRRQRGENQPAHAQRANGRHSAHTPSLWPAAFANLVSISGFCRFLVHRAE